MTKWNIFTTFIQHFLFINLLPLFWPNCPLVVCSPERFFRSPFHHCDVWSSFLQQSSFTYFAHYFTTNISHISYHKHISTRPLYNILKEYTIRSGLMDVDNPLGADWIFQPATSSSENYSILSLTSHQQPQKQNQQQNTGFLINLLVKSAVFQNQNKTIIMPFHFVI